MVEHGAVALWMRVTDRFGDNGLVGVAIAVPKEETRWEVDSFLMSCRVLGRKVESALLASLIGDVRSRGGRILEGRYIPTAKNSMVKSFYSSQGFEKADPEGEWWRLDCSEKTLPFPPYVRIIRANEEHP
jgi:FkbH-like protein